jgi:two-component system chemotaxis response regulator CheB
LPLSGFAATAVLIGASTGGPPLVEQILRALPPDFPAAVAVCQHMPHGFVDRWAERLGPLCWLRVKVAEDGERFERGNVYIAPVGRHLRFRPGRTPALRLDEDFADALYVPSVDYLFSSAAEAFGSRALGVLLTGLGSDGALGLMSLRRAGSYTLIQRPETAVAASMPEAAAEMGAAMEVVAASDMPRVVVERANGRY